MGIRRIGTALALLGMGGVAVTVAGPAAAAPAVTIGWHVDPGAAQGGTGAVNVAGTRGRLTIAAHRSYALAYPPPTTVRAAVTRIDGVVVADRPAGASVEVAVRGRYRAGWSAWQRLPARLAEPTTGVQVRLTLHAGTGGAPVVRDVAMTGVSGRGQSRIAAAAEYRVYATREGLVGGTTANGHVVASHDHFVSLPSWSALSPKGTGDYSVRACTGGRCAYEPVWDVGPWNTHDDYWNVAREQWRDLPPGMPEAQAAVQRGYNGGLDQYGRRVLNPAGIDLADGTVWDDLRLTDDNRWVTVTYLWFVGTRGRVETEGSPLNVRGGPGTGYPSVGMAARYARVPVECQATGEPITGAAGTSRLWDRIGPGNYVSHAYVVMDAGVAAPRC